MHVPGLNGAQIYLRLAPKIAAMNTISLYCKSFSTDLKRVIRLAESVARHNKSQIEFFISVPQKELKLFQNHLRHLPAILLADEEIIAANSSIRSSEFSNLPGHLGQQIVKSEFWRINPSKTYLCLDSDSVFIRDFEPGDYITSEGVPYTVLTEAHDLQFDALTRGKNQILENFQREAASIQQLFEREGRAYSFGPMPMVWHRDVWESLEDAYLKPRHLNFMDAIHLAPLESRWYGEALLKFQAIPLLPCEPFFKVYHYAWQLDQDRRRGLHQEQLARLYSGIIYQSSWERSMDWPYEGGSRWSRMARLVRRKLGKM